MPTLTAAQDRSLADAGAFEPLDKPALIADLIPDDPLEAQLWVDCFRWACGFEPLLSAYMRKCGAMDVRKFAEWFQANVWVEEG